MLKVSADYVCTEVCMYTASDTFCVAHADFIYSKTVMVGVEKERCILIGSWSVIIPSNISGTVQ